MFNFAWWKASYLLVEVIWNEVGSYNVGQIYFVHLSFFPIGLLKSVVFETMITICEFFFFKMLESNAN